MIKYIYIAGADNAEFRSCSHFLEERGKKIGFRRSGPYAVTTYKSPFGGTWERWDDVDNGTPYSIERVF